MKMKLATLVVAIALPIGFATPAMAQDQADGTMTVTGTVVSSIGLTIESGGGAFSGGGTNAASSALGNLSKNGSVPAGFTRQNTASDSTLTGSIGIKVTQANGASTSYTLTAQLGSALPSGVVWSLGGLAITDGPAVQLTAIGTYGATPTYAWTINVLDTVANATSIANSINFTAIGN